MRGTRRGESEKVSQQIRGRRRGARSRARARADGGTENEKGGAEILIFSPASQRVPLDSVACRATPRRSGRCEGKEPLRQMFDCWRDAPEELLLF